MVYAQVYERMCLVLLHIKHFGECDTKQMLCVAHLTSRYNTYKCRYANVTNSNQPQTCFL